MPAARSARRWKVGARRPPSAEHARLFASHLAWYLPLMPIAIEQLDLTGYALVVSSNTAVAKA